ncbi:MAG: hypothetical protein U9N82_02750 [Thermodesulfobacteriota bacterium]|nr:hypothetical protein [Thermodesulfobacteriota bacterium]
MSVPPLFCFLFLYHYLRYWFNRSHNAGVTNGSVTSRPIKLKIRASKIEAGNNKELDRIIKKK